MRILRVDEFLEQFHSRMEGKKKTNRGLKSKMDYFCPFFHQEQCSRSPPNIMSFPHTKQYQKWRVSQVSLLVKNLPARTGDLKRDKFNLWVGKIPWRKAPQPTPVLSWRIPWTEEPGGLQSKKSQRAGLNWSKLAHALTHTVK